MGQGNLTTIIAVILVPGQTLQREVEFRQSSEFFLSSIDKVAFEGSYNRPKKIPQL